METTKERKEEREVGGGDKEVGDPFFISEKRLTPALGDEETLTS